MYKALDLSKYIIRKCISDGFPISNLLLQKILYAIQREYLLKFDKLAFSDDFEAWKVGPVIPDVFYAYCGFGAMLISFSLTDFPISPEDAAIVDPLIEQRWLLKPWEFAGEYCEKDGAWSRVYQGGVGNRKIIPVELIKEFG